MPVLEASDEDLFKLAVDLSPSGMLAVDAEGRIVLVNRELERLFGYTREELIGQSIDLLVPSRFRHAHPSAREGYLRVPTARPMGTGRDLRGRRKDGVEVPVEIGLTPVPTTRGVVVLASVVDISERRRAEEQLRQSQKMEAIGTLAGGIAHDFNNILAGIIGYTELAQQGAMPEQRGDLEEVLRAAQRGRLLVQRILTFSQRREVERSRLALARPVREALQLLRASLPSSVELVEVVDVGVPEVLSDDTQVHQIVMNLSTNAAHAMPDGGRITVELSPFFASEHFCAQHPNVRPGPYARLSVRDTGLGMSEEVAKRAFEPFFTTKSENGGSGLGLSVLHGIVSQHGGAILLRSTLGVGTVVDVLLPAEATAQTTSSSSRGAPHILLVDDEPTLSKLMKRQLEQAGYRVTAFVSSPEALEFFEFNAADIDVLISDNSMPRMSGLQLLQKALAIKPDLPVVLVSGLAETADKEALTRMGVSRLLPKPYAGAELQRALLELLGDRALRW